MGSRQTQHGQRHSDSDWLRVEGIASQRESDFIERSADENVENRHGRIRERGGEEMHAQFEL